jgi:hypothetical protein
MVKTILGLILSFTLQQSPAISINELIEQSLDLDHQTITLEAEVIGEVLERGENAWINVNDGTNAIGIYLTLDQTKQLKVFGDYFNVGDVVRVQGIFERSCVEHGGEMDIHASSIQVIKAGHPITHAISPWKFVLTIILMSIALMGLYMKKHFFRKATLEIHEDK